MLLDPLIIESLDKFLIIITQGPKYDIRSQFETRTKSLIIFNNRIFCRICLIS